MHQRDRRRAKRQEKIQRILEEFRASKSISCIKSGRKRTPESEVFGDDDTNAAAVDTEQAESILVVEATATRNRGEDTDAAAAPNLDEGASTTAAVTCNPSEDTIQRKETMRSEDSLRKGETLRKETTTN